MRILVNAASAKIGGIVTYIMGVTKELAALDIANEYIFLLPPERIEHMVGLPENFHLIATRAGELSFLKRLYWEQIILRRLIKKEKIDILLSVANNGLLFAPCKQLLIVRNALYFSELYLKHFEKRQSFRQRLEFRLRRWLIIFSTRMADVVMTPSQSMKDELCHYAKQDAGKMVVNYYGSAMVDGQTKVYGKVSNIPKFRLLFVSHYEAHKNFGILLQAIKLLRCQMGISDIELISTIDIEHPLLRCPPVSYEEDRKLLVNPVVVSSLNLTGELPYEKLHELYAQADIFVFPSIAESFGQPMVEAMAFGLPIVAADTPINREICAGAAIYFSPFDTQELANIIAELINNSDLRDKLSRVGIERASAFTWRNHATRLLSVINTTFSVRNKNQ